MQKLSNDCGKFEKDVFYKTDNRLYWIGAIFFQFFPIYTHFIVLFVQMSASLDWVEIERCNSSCEEYFFYGS